MTPTQPVRSGGTRPDRAGSSDHGIDLGAGTGVEVGVAVGVEVDAGAPVRELARSNPVPGGEGIGRGQRTGAHGTPSGEPWSMLDVPIGAPQF